MSMLRRIGSLHSSRSLSGHFYRSVNEWARKNPDLEVPERPDLSDSDHEEHDRLLQEKSPAKKIPIDLFPDLRSSKRSGSKFHPFSSKAQTMILAQRSDQSRKQNLRLKSRERIIKIAELVSNLSLHTKLSSILSEISLTGSDLEDLVYELEFRGKLELALEILQQTAHDVQVSLSIKFFEQFLDHLLLSRHPLNRVNKLLQLVNERGLELDLRWYYTIGVQLIEEGKVEKALELLEFKDGSKSKLEVCNRILDTSLAVKKPQLGVLVFKQMKKMEELELDSLSFTLGMTCAFHRHEDQLLFTSFTQLKEKGIKPDMFVYNLLIKASERVNDTSMALRIFDEMKQEAGIFPNVKTYNALIRLCGRKGLLTRALELFKEMQSMGNKPSLLTFNGLITAAVKAEKATLAFELFEKMIKEYGLLPNTFTFTSLIKSCGIMQDLEQMRWVLNEMRRYGLQRDVIAFSAAIEVCVKCQNLPEALNLLHEMVAAGIQPNEVTKEILIKGCIAASSKSIGVILLEDMKKSGLTIDLEVYHTLMAACETAGDLSGALNWKQRMQDAGFQPTVKTYSLLISACRSSRDLQTGRELLQEGCWEIGLSNSLVLYNTFLELCIHSEQYEEAFKKFEELKNPSNSGLAPDIRSFNLMIEMSIKMKDFGYIDLFLNDMKNREILPNTWTQRLLE